MGRDSIAACLDCRQVYDVGYGSGLTWLDDAKTVAEFDRLAAVKMDDEGDPLAERGKNRCWRAFLVAHETHQFVQWSSDWTSSRTINGRSIVRGDFNKQEVADVTGFAWFYGEGDGTFRPAEAPVFDELEAYLRVNLDEANRGVTTPTWSKRRT